MALNDGLHRQVWLRGEHWFFAVLVCFYLLPGIIGHDPWKQDETYITDIVHQMLLSGDWTVPMMAGVPFMEKPPLFYWLAALCARLFSPVLALHDGARIATAIFLAGTCVATACAGARCWAGRHGKVAVAVLLSCLGMERHAHMMLTDLAMLFGFAVAVCGLLLCVEQPNKGGLVLGTGAGIAFLGKGLYAPGVLAISALALPMLFKQWRQRGYLRALRIALVAALPWLLIWPALLLYRSPDLFKDWLWANNFGRFFGFSVGALGAAHTPWFWAANLPWITFPAWPLAVVTLLRLRRRALVDPALQLALILCAVLLAVLACSASARDNYALPILIPLALIGAPSAETLPPWMDTGWRRCAGAIFGLACAAVWLGWLFMMANGRVPPVPLLFRYLPAQFHPSFNWCSLIVAAAGTIGPGWLAMRSRVSGRSGLSAWFVGLTMTWTLLIVLWGPWIDAAKSYRGVFQSIGAAVPDGVRCVSERGVGESELAMMHYFVGLSLRRNDTSPNCGARLIEGVARQVPDAGPGGPWRLAWTGARLGDDSEGFWLFLRGAPANLPRDASADDPARPAVTSVRVPRR